MLLSPRPRTGIINIHHHANIFMNWIQSLGGAISPALDLIFCPLHRQQHFHTLGFCTEDHVMRWSLGSGSQRDAGRLSQSHWLTRELNISPIIRTAELETAGRANTVSVKSPGWLWCSLEPETLWLVYVTGSKRHTVTSKHPHKVCWVTIATPLLLQ